MKAPLSWLQEFVDINIGKDITVKELCDKLLNAGFEVEEAVYLGEGLEKVVAGKILSMEKHPAADKLAVCKIDVGSETLTVVTGAKNVSVGDIVPVALVGAALPSGKEIKEGDLRGITSYGMLCSGGELNIDDNIYAGASVEGVMILNAETLVGSPMASVLDLDDHVLDISVTANRPDCQSIYGIARELSVILNKPLKEPKTDFKEDATATKLVCKIKNPELCTRYIGREAVNIVVKPSPQLIKSRLLKVGIRPINNIVDITNYVLTEIGQPMHAFDADKMKGEKIVVRRAKKGEELFALDEKTYKLNSDMLAVCDEKNVAAVAGVMGGELSGVSDKTTRVFFEAARFRRESVRRTSRALGLRSASSARFEKGVDPYTVQLGMSRALSLLRETSSGTVLSGVADDLHCSLKEKQIKTTFKAIFSVLGIEIDHDIAVGILNRLGFKTVQAGARLTVSVPLYREDIDNHADLAEEIIRIYGYHNIPARLMDGACSTIGGRSKEQMLADRLKGRLCALGAYEINTYSFLPESHLAALSLSKDDSLITIRNPLSEEYKVMRQTLVYNMLSTISLNLNRKNKDIQLFEIGRGYLAKQQPLTELPIEKSLLCYGTTCGDFFALKGVAEDIACELMLRFEYRRSEAPYLHPGISADIYSCGEMIGRMGEVHPKTAEQMDIAGKAYVLEICLDGLTAQRAYAFKPLPKFPEVDRDIAVTVRADITAGEIAAEIEGCHPLISKIELFDVYTGDQIERGYKSLAYSIKLKGDRTLVDAEINDCVKHVLSILEAKFGAKLR